MSQKANLDVADSMGFTPLTLAVLFFNYDLTKILIFSGARHENVANQLSLYNHDRSNNAYFLDEIKQSYNQSILEKQSENFFQIFDFFGPLPLTSEESFPLESITVAISDLNE